MSENILMLLAVDLGLNERSPKPITFVADEFLHPPEPYYIIGLRHGFGNEVVSRSGFTSGVAKYMARRINGFYFSFF